MMIRKVSINKRCKNSRIKYHRMKVNLKTDGLTLRLTKTAKILYKMNKKTEYK